MWTLGVEALAQMALGSRLFGGGGGGDTLGARLVAHQALEDCGQVRVLRPDELDPDALVAGVVVIGTPTVLVEKLPSTDQLAAVVRAEEARLGQKIEALIPVVIGGMELFYPIAAAAALHLPCLDADGMGRTLPVISMTTFTLAGVNVAPLCSADAKGNVISLDTADNRLAGAIARLSAMTLGMANACVCYPMSAATACQVSIPGSLTRCLEFGGLLAQAQAQGTLEPVLGACGGRELGDGVVIAVDRKTTFGFPKGSVTLELFGGQGTMRVEMQNEFLVAIVDGEVVATVPDLISIFDINDLEPLYTDEIQEGQRVRVAVMPCAPQWRQPGMADLVGPAAFGYHVDPVGQA
ncbi:MAG: DUF917 domain-containing protein [Propionibacteriaceae bacterium]|jgi:DUF917 family protein|nr:DUF917 domain-containing protein [Propionibacteriaceae bacterium]